MPRADQWKLNDLFKRKIFLKNELKKIILKSLIKNSFIPRTNRYYAIFNKNKLARCSSIVQQKNKCIKTGRVWSTVKFTKYSRFVFRTESYSGNLPGFQRASW